MTTPKVNTIKRGSARLYVHPEGGEKAPGVTSVLNSLPKPFLTFWAAKMVADEFVSDPGTAVNLAFRNPAAAVDHLKAAPRRYTAQAAAMGTQAHDIFERMAKREPVGRVTPDMQWAVDHFQAFVNEFSPEFIFLEETVWSEKHNYAGSFDVLMKIRDEDGVERLVWGDWKTNGAMKATDTNQKPHEDVALQLNAYGHADYIIRPDGSKVPLPKADGAVVLHVHPTGWGLYPVAYGPEVFEDFLICRSMYDLVNDRLKTYLGKPTGSGLPAKKRTPAPRKKAA
jgi:hypothetical protein